MADDDFTDERTPAETTRARKVKERLMQQQQVSQGQRIGLLEHRLDELILQVSEACDLSAHALEVANNILREVKKLRSEIDRLKP